MAPIDGLDRPYPYPGSTTLHLRDAASICYEGCRLEQVVKLSRGPSFHSGQIHGAHRRLATGTNSQPVGHCRQMNWAATPACWAPAGIDEIDHLDQQKMITRPSLVTSVVARSEPSFP